MKLFYYLILTILFVSCNRTEITRKLDRALDIAGENRSELETVLNHYEPGSLEYKSAKFLIENMPDHIHLQSSLMDIFRDSIPQTRDNKVINTLWEKIADSLPDNSEYLQDTRSLSADYIIRNIDEAFTVWNSVKWKNEIDFDIFCKYILPYKVANEPIVEWRSSLREEYLPSIDTIADLDTAFEIIYKEVMGQFRNLWVACPYPRDPIITNKAKIGNCFEKAVFMVYVMRSLGIPCAVDFNLKWANYGNTAHEWVALIKKGGRTLYVFDEENPEVQEFGDIDASVLSYSYPYDNENSLYIADTLKKTAKVYRRTYERFELPETFENENLVEVFNDTHILDVSEHYGKKNSITVSVKENEKYKNVYLCTFSHGSGWHLISITEIKKNKAVFKNLEADIVYLPSYFNGKRIIALSNPIILNKNGTPRVLDPVKENRITATLYRKYILMGQWIDRWSKFIGCRFEASEHSDFRENIVLKEIKDIPFGNQVIRIDTSKPFRYIRFVTPVEDSTVRYQVPNLSEIAFYTKNEEDKLTEIKPKIIAEGHDIDNPMRTVNLLSDGKYLTGTFWRYPYTISIDLGSTVH
ncbi:MAG: transglutaminase-like domain-containing protein [Rikenellaceae bacterium]|nr:transglutaminase-like domain-containing protein [Rikenellaceae bacterium]